MASNARFAHIQANLAEAKEKIRNLEREIFALTQERNHLRVQVDKLANSLREEQLKKTEE